MTSVFFFSLTRLDSIDLKIAISANLGQLTRDICLRNRSKLVTRSLFAIIGLLQGAKSILLYFIWHVGGMIFI